jgi:16S rRNA (guanine966-N2)-methyltransferase
MSLRIHGNRPLKTLPGLATRPTPAKVREALFNIWHHQIPGCRWLDLCAGSGAMGAEALSRGAAVVVGIEQSASACKIIHQNWESIRKPDQQCLLLRGDVIHRLRSCRGQEFDRIYFDPPYQSHLYQPVLDAIAQSSLLALGGEMAIEYSPQFPPEIRLDGWQVQETRAYGNTALMLINRQA